jgi:glycosyltransferase involved in cell wall biosynthesis
VDAAFLRRLAPGRRIDVIPNGVDVDYFDAPSARAQAPRTTGPRAQTLVFTGTLWYHPNKDGLQYFLNDIWPLIRERRPDVRFWIVGAGPVPAMLEEESLPEGVEVFASVEDVRPFLAASDVAVVPLRLGSGTRLKILEALAAHRPVVSTALGAEGLDLKPGRDLVIADSAAAFADAVLALLERPDEAGQLATHGREAVRRVYSWSAIATTFQALLHDVMARRARGLP